MTTEDLLVNLEPGAELSIENTTFTYIGKAKLTLEGNEVVYWLYAEDDSILSVSPETEEIVVLHPVEEDVEHDEEGAVYRNETFEFSYSETGAVTNMDGDAPAEEGEIFDFREFESSKGSLLRIVENQVTGESFSLIGKVVIEDDILMS